MRSSTEVTDGRLNTFGLSPASTGVELGSASLLTPSTESERSALASWSSSPTHSRPVSIPAWVHDRPEPWPPRWREIRIVGCRSVVHPCGYRNRSEEHTSELQSRSD